MESKKEESFEVPLPIFLQKNRKTGEDELDALENHKGVREERESQKLDKE